ncbi:hypothetical protein RJZ90_003237 [Blastomyces dermatitidis]
MASALPIIDLRAFSTVEELAPELMRLTCDLGTRVSGMRNTVAEHVMVLFSSSLAGKGHGYLRVVLSYESRCWVETTFDQYKFGDICLTACGRLCSTIRRVAFPRNESENTDRLSMLFFVQPDRDVLMEPILPGEADQEEFKDVLRRRGYPSARPLTAEEHLTQRLRATYGY